MCCACVCLCERVVDIDALDYFKKKKDTRKKERERKTEEKREKFREQAYVKYITCEREREIERERESVCVKEMNK